MATAASKQLTDCPCNLKEAIDWILRVTGKDGQGGGDNAFKLAQAVKELLEGAVKELDGLPTKSHKNVNELKKLKDGLTKARQWVEEDAKCKAIYKFGLIGRISRALAAFIGYSEFTISSDVPAGRLTGAGIAPSNLPVHRLCDATMGFTIALLMGTRGSRDSNLGDSDREKIEGAISKLYESYGKGVQGLRNAAKDVHGFSGFTGKGNGGNEIKGLVKKVGEEYGKFCNASSTVTDVANKIKEYLQAVVKEVHGKINGKLTGSSQNVDGLSTPLSSLVRAVTEQFNTTYNVDSVSDKSDKVGEALTKIQSAIKSLKTTDPTAYTLVSALLSGTKSFMRELWKENYVSYYDAKATWKGADHMMCAKIFLSCFPIIYHGLTHLSWRCSNNNSWSNLQFNGFGGRGGTLNHFMVGAGYTEYNKLSSSEGGNVMAAVASRLPEFKNVVTSTRNSYTDYLKALQDKFNGTLTPSTGAATLQDQTMPALFFAAQTYFQHARLSKSGDPKSPTTIREILYWMAGLPFSPGYGELEKYVGALVPEGGLYVANAETKIRGDIIKAADMKGYLLTSCLSIPGLLGVIQGSSGSEKEPWLHTLLSNGLSFKYPSGPELFKLLCDYTYALQFQLSFLYNKCRSGYDEGFGWRDCKYGSEANNNSNTPMTSFICHADCESKHSTSNAKCEHVKHDGSQCGKQAGKPSPIQAFLTDNLKGFSLTTRTNNIQYAEGHMKEHPPGALCHIPMGFTTSTIKAGRNPVYHIYVVLEGICGGAASPLRQLYETLTCLTRRVPKSLSDWFGFYWYLVGTWDRGSGQSRLSVKQAIESTAEGVIGGYCGAMTQLIDVIHGLVRHCHNAEANSYEIKHIASHLSQSSLVGSDHTCSTAPFDLWSVANGVHKSRTPDCNKSTANCGGYLSPLTLTESSAFAPSLAPTYLSWIVYLPDEFRVLLEGLLDGFKKIVCNDCVHTSTGQTCSNESGKHGETTICKCPSVVQCVGVYGLLYEHGFRFTSAYSLNGENAGKKNETKRSCDKLLTVLSNILSEHGPLRSLPEVMETFIFQIRFPFLATIVSQWSLFLMVLVNIFLFRLDLLHFRSHVRLPSSHSIPPLALLTSGKTSPIKKLMYYLP
ncbi:variant erythrocyte surface antigen-1 family protein [Babesia caballi]|uniref:Variant erythrocyte surface antigen-1 family protein n=1 Tax=Babesia caballi TaxID=5871 RepID=A0AAV4LT72_BABCB|nr:variant erythrocyte surface antigen-1 family protein [Babesia caballi]